MWLTPVLLLAFLVQDVAKPLPDARSFMENVRKNMRTDVLLLSQYTYTEKRTTTEVDSNERPKKTDVDVYEVFPGSEDRVLYRRQIVKDGKPVSSKDLEKQDRENQKRNQISPEKRKRDLAERRAEEQAFIEDLFGAYDIQIVRRENVQGEPAIVVEFRPRANPAYKTKSKQGKMLRNFMGRAWFNENDYEGMRLEVEAIQPVNIGFGLLAKLQKGGRIVTERRKFNDEVWLPIKVDVSLDLRLLLLKGLKIRQTVEYSDHKKYSVDTILKFPDEFK